MGSWGQGLRIRLFSQLSCSTVWSTASLNAAKYQRQIPVRPQRSGALRGRQSWPLRSFRRFGKALRRPYGRPPLCVRFARSRGYGPGLPSAPWNLPLPPPASLNRPSLPRLRDRPPSSSHNAPSALSPPGRGTSSGSTRPALVARNIFSFSWLRVDSSVRVH